MTLKKNVALAAAMVAAMASSSAWAASENANAEFAAVYVERPILVTEERPDADAYSYCTIVYPNGGAGDCSGLPESTGMTMASIKVAQSKELLVGVSAQMQIYTMTEVTGKRGATSRAVADAGGGVEVRACTDDGNGGKICYQSLSGMVTLSQRNQDLSATLGGVLESCTVTDGVFDLADCTVSEEEIALGLTTLAAHHYNFLFPNLPVGTYDIEAHFTAGASTLAQATCEVENTTTGCVANSTEQLASATAEAWVVISKATTTIQEVRAIKAWSAESTPIEM